MSDPIDLNKAKQARRKSRARAKTMCGRGFHKWQFDEKKQFDPQQGKLVSIQRCQHCGETRTVVS